MLEIAEKSERLILESIHKAELIARDSGLQRVSISASDQSWLSVAISSPDFLWHVSLQGQPQSQVVEQIRAICNQLEHGELLLAWDDTTGEGYDFEACHHKLYKANDWTLPHGRAVHLKVG